MSNDEDIIAQKWFRERLRPGNWLDIAPEENIPPEIKGWSRTFAHMSQVCFSPEIRHRLEAGKLANEFFLWGAQLLQPHEGDRQIRLNEEVRGVTGLRTGRPIEKGEQVLLGDLAGLEYFDLHDDELDCGHFTVFWTGSAWVGAFDFRAGRGKCLALIEKSLKFAASARLSVKNDLAEPAIDTLHTACELLAKTRLILGHLPAHKWTSHGSVISAINRERKLGNIDPAFTDLFNRLSNIRSLAKYATGYDAALPTRDDVDLVENMALGLQRAVAQKGPGDTRAEDGTTPD